MRQNPPPSGKTCDFAGESIEGHLEVWPLDALAIIVPCGFSFVEFLRKFSALFAVLLHSCH